MNGNIPLNIVYFGAPGFAVPALRMLAADPRFKVELVVSQPDRPSGRGRAESATAVSSTARELDLPLYQPVSLRTQEARQPLVEARADLFVVAAFGLIFGKSTLSIPRLGCLNLHASLLPAYRGASPIQAAILSGDAVTGVTLMRMDAGLDTGDMIASNVIAINPDDTTESLTGRLAASAAELSVGAIPAFANGELTPAPQPSAGGSLTRPLTKADGQLDWKLPAVVLERQTRAMWPWPRVWTTVGETRLQVIATEAVSAERDGPPGTARVVDGALAVSCGAGLLRLDRVQPAGGKPMRGADFLRGMRTESVRFGLLEPGNERTLIVLPLDSLDKN